MLDSIQKNLLEHRLRISVKTPFHIIIIKIIKSTQILYSNTLKNAKNIKRKNKEKNLNKNLHLKGKWIKLR